MLVSLPHLRQTPDQQLLEIGMIDLKDKVNDIQVIKDIAPLNVKAIVKLIEPHLINIDAIQSTNMVLTCMRCLQDYKTKAHSQWSEKFTDRKVKKKDDEDLEINYVDGHSIDLLPHILDHFHLSVPYIPLCKEDCQGLCKRCGVDKNETICFCTDEKLDPRLERLQDLFPDDSED